MLEIQRHMCNVYNTAGSQLPMIPRTFNGPVLTHFSSCRWGGKGTITNLALVLFIRTERAMDCKIFVKR